MKRAPTDNLVKEHLITFSKSSNHYEIAKDVIHVTVASNSLSPVEREIQLTDLKEKFQGRKSL